MGGRHGDDAELAIVVLQRAKDRSMKSRAAAEKILECRRRPL